MTKYLKFIEFSTYFSIINRRKHKIGDLEYCKKRKYWVFVPHLKLLDDGDYEMADLSWECLDEISEFIKRLIKEGAK